MSISDVILLMKDGEEQQVMPNILYMIILLIRLQLILGVPAINNIYGYIIDVTFYTNDNSAVLEH